MTSDLLQWTGLSGWLEQPLEAAGIDEDHLVVNDLGGPIGFDLVRRAPERVALLVETGEDR